MKQIFFSVSAALVLAAAGCAQNATSAQSTTVAKGAKMSCDAASLTLPDDASVGSYNGKTLTYKDLGPEVKKAEEKALRSYCDAVSGVRRIAFDNYVTEDLVAAAAKKNNQTNDEWIRAEVEKRVPNPGPAEIQAFYDKEKSGPNGAQLPPFDEVKDQITAFMKREKSQSAVEDIINDLQKTAAIERKLPDVRSAAMPLENAKHTPTKGKAGAKVKVVEFADYQCPYCSKAAETFLALADKYGDRVEFSFRNFPLRSIHPDAQRAAEIAQCAGEQGKFWDTYKALFANQGALDEATVKKTAIGTGIDAGKLDECLAAGRGAAMVDEDVKKGEEVGVEGTPSFFINGRSYSGNPTVAAIGEAIEEELKAL